MEWLDSSSSPDRSTLKLGFPVEYLIPCTALSFSEARNIIRNWSILSALHMYFYLFLDSIEVGIKICIWAARREIVTMCSVMEAKRKIAGIVSCMLHWDSIESKTYSKKYTHYGIDWSLATSYRTYECGNSLHVCLPDGTSSAAGGSVC
jgi:hypothetical protein